MCSSVLNEYVWVLAREQESTRMLELEGTLTRLRVHIRASFKFQTKPLLNELGVKHVKYKSDPFPIVLPYYNGLGAMHG